ncbi:MAG TPA: hypothetical protein VLE22_20705 [Bryobacteraceae bacterium]|nr:hypothetical protein [Bryobacteraceae bacterium]
MNRRTFLTLPLAAVAAGAAPSRPNVLILKPVAREDLHFTIESRDGFHFAVRRGEWKLVRHEPRPSGGAVNQLYRLDEDPQETKDVAAAHPALVKELAASIEKWRKLYPAEGTRLENRPPAGWKAPSQWAEAARR